MCEIYSSLNCVRHEMPHILPYTSLLSIYRLPKTVQDNLGAKK